MKIEITTYLKVITSHTLDVSNKTENHIAGLLEIEKERAVEGVSQHIKNMQSITIESVGLAQGIATVEITGFEHLDK